MNLFATAATGITGYGHVGNEFINLLYTQYTKNIELRTEEHHWTGSKCLHPKFQPMMLELLTNKFHNIDLYYTLWNPSYLPTHTGVPSILETVFETDIIKNDWVEDCNRADVTWVPSKFCAKAFKDSGVNNIKYMPYGFNFSNTKETIPILNNDSRFKFLFLNQWSERKFAEQTVRTFCETFNAKDKVVLYIRAEVSPGLEQIGITASTKNEQLNLIKNDNPDSPQIILLDRVTDDTLPKLYNSIDCLLSPSRAEGVGRPMVEAMSMGTPVITTNWSSMPEFVNKTNGLLVESECTNINLPLYEQEIYSLMPNMHWATPNVDDISRCLKYAVDNPTAMFKLGCKAKKDIRKQFNWDVLFKKRIKSMEEIL